MTLSSTMSFRLLAALASLLLTLCLLPTAALGEAPGLTTASASTETEATDASLGSGTWTVAIPALKDNTLYQNAAGGLSNGAGSYVFAGRTAQPLDNLRRAVLAFDAPGRLPGNATIGTVELLLTMDMSIAGASSINMHRLDADWGEGTSTADMGEGGGGPSTPDDATWIHRTFNTATWTNPGGDFQTAVSATQSVDGNGRYTWGSTTQLVSDVNGWLTAPSTNFGWILVGDEATSPSAKRFASRENPTQFDRPALVITYDSPDVIFISGFEDGGTGAWGSAVP